MTPEERTEIIIREMKMIRAGQGLGSGWNFPWNSLRIRIIDQIREAERAEKGRK